MSQVAGRMSVSVAAHCLQTAQGGLGLMLGGVPGVLPAKVVIIGGGWAGYSAADSLSSSPDTQVTVLEASPRAAGGLARGHAEIVIRPCH